jgi:hypothetical protein
VALKSGLESAVLFGFLLFLFPLAKTVDAKELPTIIPLALVDIIPESLSAETNNDSEPFITVDLSDPNRMVISALTPNPNLYEIGRAPIFVTSDGGRTWRLSTIVASDLKTSDITVAAGADKTLYAGVLKLPSNSTSLALLKADDFEDDELMVGPTPRLGVDQPHVQARRAGNLDQVYVGSNDQGAKPNSAVIDLSLDSGKSYKTVRLEHRATAGLNGPSVRIAAATNDETVYAAFFGWRKYKDGMLTSDVVVVRDDKAGASANPFQDLIDDQDGLPGRLVQKGITIPWENRPILGCERIGSSLSIAVDPTNSNIVYVAWADRVGDGDIFSIHVRRTLDRGKTWSQDLIRIRDANPFSLKIAGNGTVGFLFQQFGPDQRWKTHLIQTRDGFASVADTILADVPNGIPPCLEVPYNGDYNGLIAIGEEFRGVFSASNQARLGNFPSIKPSYQRGVDFENNKLTDGSGGEVTISIDPFYFSVPLLK